MPFGYVNVQLTKFNWFFNLKKLNFEKHNFQIGKAVKVAAKLHKYCFGEWDKSDADPPIL